MLILLSHITKTVILDINKNLFVTQIHFFFFLRKHLQLIKQFPILISQGYAAT